MKQPRGRFTRPLFLLAGAAQIGIFSAESINETSGRKKAMATCLGKITVSPYFLTAFIAVGMLLGGSDFDSSKVKAEGSPTINEEPNDDFPYSLLGEWWTAEGRTFGMPSTVYAKWERVLQSRFARILYKIEIRVAPDSTQIFEGVGYYKMAGINRYKGTWFDSGGEMHPTSASSDSISLSAVWGTPDTKLGKSVYRLVEENALEIVDSIQTKNGSWREFSRNLLKRK